jgi:hypothetical protein
MINAVAVSYYKSPDFRALKASTQTMRRNIIENFRNAHGDESVKLLREHSRKSSVRSPTRHAARTSKPGQGSDRSPSPCSAAGAVDYLSCALTRRRTGGLWLFGRARTRRRTTGVARIVRIVFEPILRIICFVRHHFSLPKSVKPMQSMDRRSY